ncbi:MAG TPA: hypothetical protein VD978_13380 [Azospirillum sp.]|nr:hypothetical protein [Azospirillum sp.]
MSSKGLRGSGSGDAAREHLAAGRPIVYCDDSTPAGHVIKKYPDGRKELIDYSTDSPRLVSVIEPGHDQAQR